MMNGLDTNVLVRYLVKDDVRQAKIAADAIKSTIISDGRCFINHIVLCELVWVLEAAYEYTKKEIAATLEKILMTRQFEIESKDILHLALNDYSNERGDLSDYLIGRINQAERCGTTLTFDRKLKHSSIFRLLE